MKKVLTAILACAVILTLAAVAGAADLANYALNCPVTVSGLESADANLGEAAVDGDMATRWSSDYVDDAYITVDLGSPKPVGYIELHWEAAYAVDFVIETGSTEGEVEHTVATVTGNTELDNVFTFDTVTARYITVRCSKRATEWGNSLYEIVVRKTAEEEVSNANANYPSSGYTPKAGSSLINGVRIGLEEGWGGNAAAGRDAAFDGDPNTFFDPLGTGDGWAGIDAGKEYKLTAILIHPRDGQLARFNGGTIEGSNDPDFADATAIFFSVEEASEFAWITIEEDDFDDNGSFRYFRYINYTNHGDVGDIELYGEPADGVAVEMNPNYPSSGFKPKDGSSLIRGSLIGLEVGWGDNAAAGRDAAFDGDPNTFFDPLGTGDGWAGIDAGKPYTLTSILIHPRDGQLPRFNGGTIEGSNDPDFNDATAIFFSVEEATEFAWVTIDESDFDDNGSFRYFRYINYTNHGDVGDIELYGYPSEGGAASASAGGGEPTLLWDFNGDELMSDNMGANSNNGVMFYGEEDYYTFMATGNDPYVSIDTPMDAVEDIWWAKIRVHNNSPATAVELFGATNGRSLSGPECTHFEIDSNSDEWKTYIIYIPDENVKTANTYKGATLEETYWEGNVDWIRLDPMWHEGDDGSDNGGSCESGDEIQIDYIAFFANEADAKAFRADQDAPTKYVAPAKAEEPAAEEAPNPIEEAAAAVSETASEAVEAVEEAAADAVEAVEEVAADAAEAVSDAVEEAKSGCGSVIGGGLIVLVTILGCGWMTSRKH